MTQADLKVYGDLVKAEFELVYQTVKDKGGKRFGKAFGLAGIMIVIAYGGIYAPPKKKLSRLDRDIASAKAMFDSGGQFKELRDSLTASYSRLPPLKDRAQWLGNATMDSLRAEGITPEAIKPMTENDMKGLVFQSQPVQLTAKFSEFYAWLLRLESAKPLMHLQGAEISKKDDRIGHNSVNCIVTTVVPTRRLNN